MHSSTEKKTPIKKKETEILFHPLPRNINQYKLKSLIMRLPQLGCLRHTCRIYGAAEVSFSSNTKRFIFIIFLLINTTSARLPPSVLFLPRFLFSAPIDLRSLSFDGERTFRDLAAVVSWSDPKVDFNYDSTHRVCYTVLEQARGRMWVAVHRGDNLSICRGCRWI